MLDWLNTRFLTDPSTTALLLAFVLGLLIGAEREWRRHPGGMRVCILVAVASAALADLMVTRVATSNLGAGFGAIATGVGFLGGGMILREGLSVRGLSTAATIWCVAAVGANAGAGEIAAVITLTVLILGVHIVVRPLSTYLRRHPAPESADAP